jgi:peptide deformylase
MLPIRLYPDSALSRVCQKVDTDLVPNWHFIEQMIATMHSAKGVGLAANQVGEDMALFVMQDSSMRQPLVVANPEILEGDDKMLLMEGCLSLPGLVAKVPRWTHVKLKCQVAYMYANRWDEDILEFRGLQAQAIQHEVDHLSGLIYLDKLSVADRLALLATPNVLT